MSAWLTRGVRALIYILSITLLTGYLVALSSDPADAATDPTYNVMDRPAGAVTADALPTVQIDGVVWDQAIVGDTVFAGGQFANARPAGAAAGTNLTPRANLLSFNIRTGVLNTGFNPGVNGRIRAMTLSPDKSRLYIVGSFTQAGGQTRNRVAAFNTATGALISTFAPNAAGDVFGVAATNTAVYLGGWFGSVNGVARTRLAAVNPTNGALLGWAPTANSTVNTLVMTPDKSRVVVGGIFSQLNGATAFGLGSLDASTGASYPFAANQVIQNYGNTAGIQSLQADANNIYGAGYYFGGTGNFEGVFVADPMTGAIKSMADCHGDSYDATPVGGVLYAVSHHHDCSNMNGFPELNPRRWLRANALTVEATGVTRTNTVGGYGNFGGQPSSSIYNWFPDVQAGTYTGQSQGGWTVEATSEYVVQGGEFPLVNNVGQQGLVRFAIPSLAPRKQGPRVSAANSAPTLRGISASSVRVTWPANWDRDDMQLTYRLFRADRPGTPLTTVTKSSQSWNRPTMVFTDTGLTGGTGYGYWVTATDPDGNTLRSATTNVTTGTNAEDNSAYSQAVLGDGAQNYWKLNDPSGSTVSTDWASANDLTLGGGVTLGGAGAVTGSPDTAAAFDGTAAGTSGPSGSEVGKTVFTVETWVRTTSTAGGKIVGFGGSATGVSSSYDRHLFMLPSGRVTFGVHPGGVRTVTTGAALNDGAWHHVVASLSPGGMALYVDGLLEASDPGTTSADIYNGYWRVGGDNLDGWPAEGGGRYFAGTIDDVAVYPTALTPAKIRDHYTKSGRTVDLPAAPADAYGARVYNDNPSLYWRLNDTAGPAVADSGVNRQPGAASGGIGFGTTSTVAPGTAAAFDGQEGTSVIATKATNDPRTYSQEVWFNTTTTNGGKLIGFGSSPSGRSGSYDRHVYMEGSGQLTFGVYTGNLNLITTPASYNDGQWHHLVATQDTESGMKLYVDGALVGTNGQIDQEHYSGYWRIGGDNTWNGTAFFQGTLDEAAVYPTALTLEQVRAHYQASGAAVNAAPVASFTVSCTQATCAVDAGASSDPDGSIAGYRFDFGDDTPVVTARTASHTYAASGTYAITLTVTDDRGRTSSRTESVEVTLPPNQLPTAAFTASCEQRVCSFDASGSSDPDGSIAGYAWTFGDGTSGTGRTPGHTYAEAGTYQVRLTVTDDDGGTDQLTRTVEVTVPVNGAPEAAFTSAKQKLRVNLDGGDSTDADGTVASWAWDFGDDSTGTGRTTSHVYTAAGTYQVKLTVTDDDGATDSVTQSVTVVANQRPTAAFTATTNDLTASLTSTSTDGDGTIASTAWNYGDGTTGTGATSSRTYAAAGTYTVTLTVTDDDGATDTATRSVTVTAPVTNVVARDDFGRTGSRWGTADTGGAWTDSGASFFATNGSTGKITIPRAGSGPSAALNAVSVRDSTTTLEFAVDKVATGTGTYVTLTSRRIGTSEYRLKARLMSDGTVRLNTTVVVSGTETLLRESTVAGLTYAPNDVLKIRFDVAGSGTTTLSGKIWKATASEPAGAQISSTNTASGLQAAGAVALQGYLTSSATNAPVVVTVDNYRVTRN